MRRWRRKKGVRQLRRKRVIARWLASEEWVEDAVDFVRYECRYIFTVIRVSRVKDCARFWNRRWKRFRSYIITIKKNYSYQFSSLFIFSFFITLVFLVSANYQWLIRMIIYQIDTMIPNSNERHGDMEFCSYLIGGPAGSAVYGFL